MGWGETILKELKEAVQAQGRLDERITSHDKQIDKNVDDIMYIMRELKTHGERLQALETGKEVLEERIILGVKSMLLEKSINPDGSLQLEKK